VQPGHENRTHEAASGSHAESYNAGQQPSHARRNFRPWARAHNTGEQQASERQSDALTNQARRHYIRARPRRRTRNPEHTSLRFARDIARCQQALGEDAVPGIRLHDLRHTHATILLLAGVPVHVVSQRLGHASPTITLGIYAHVMPGNQRDAAGLFARLVSDAGA
jgi:integrase